jgi:hypothetical protein
LGGGGLREKPDVYSLGDESEVQRKGSLFVQGLNVYYLMKKEPFPSWSFRE